MRSTYSFHFIPDVEDEIFECAACMFPTYAPTLALVSKRVRRRVEFKIYETITLASSEGMKHQKDLSSVERFEFALRARPQDFFANRVRNLCITDTVPTELTHAILSKCTGVQNLAIWQERGFDYDSSRLVRPLASTLTSLDTDRLTLERLYEQKVVFPRLKSLSVLPWPEAARVPNLEWLPVLTKVQLDLCHDYSGTEYPQDVRTVLSSAPMLRTLVLDVNAAAFRETIEEYKEETRIVIMDKALRHGDYIVEWEQFCDVHLHTHDTQ